MIDVDDADAVVQFETPGTVVYAADDAKLALYNPADDSQWIAAENALDLRGWA
jgi:hypothetical protein